MIAALNMSRLRAAFTVVLTLAASSGCIPYRFTTKPGATGRVLDARNQKPVAGAVVVSLSTTGSGLVQEGLALPAADGSFRIPASVEWGVIVGAPLPVYRRTRVEFRARGYFTAHRDFKSTSAGPEYTQLGEVPLTPTSR